MRQPQLAILLYFALLFTGGSFFLSNPKALKNGKICAHDMRCKSKCCRWDVETRMSYCAPKGHEGRKCYPETFTGLHSECPCVSDLTCILLNQEDSVVVEGYCQKEEKEEPSKN